MKRVLIFIIRGYQKFVSPMLPKNCRYYPTCSQYFIQALERYGVLKGTFLGIYPRSGLACKKGLRPANCVGVVDSDYRGEIKVALHNDTNEKQKIENRERIAQGILQTYLCMNFIEVNELSETNRGLGGFGSTGSK